MLQLMKRHGNGDRPLWIPLLRRTAPQPSLAFCRLMCEDGTVTLDAPIGRNVQPIEALIVEIWKGPDRLHSTGDPSGSSVSMPLRRWQSWLSHEPDAWEFVDAQTDLLHSATGTPTELVQIELLRALGMTKGSLVAYSDASYTVSCCQPPSGLITLSHPHRGGITIPVDEFFGQQPKAVWLQPGMSVLWYPDEHTSLPATLVEVRSDASAVIDLGSGRVSRQTVSGYVLRTR